MVRRVPVLRPYYVFAPRQIGRRIRFWWNPRRCESSVMLAWGSRLECRPDEEVGYSIHTAGIYDLALSELLYRLIRADDLCVDVGANIGYVTSLMLARGGMVFAFEPHPRLYRMLVGNAPGARCFEMAVSSSPGEAALYEPAAFGSNQGLSSLEAGGRSSGAQYRVRTETLDRLFPDEKIGVLKVDVEEHESEVWKGADSILRAHRVRDVVFEEFAPYPAESHRMLERHGYTILGIEVRLLKPVLHPAAPGRNGPEGAPINYLANVDPSRAWRLFRRFGWRCLRRGRRRDC